MLPLSLSLVEKILAATPRARHTCIPMTPSYNLPPFAFGIGPAPSHSHKSTLILTLHADPGVLLLQLEHVECNGSAVEAEKLLECGREMQMRSHCVQIWWRFQLSAEMSKVDVAPLRIAESGLEEDMRFLMALLPLLFGVGGG